MPYCCLDCGDSNYTCTAWDGTGSNKVWNEPNHNLVLTCPRDIKACTYRKKKISSPFVVPVGRGKNETL